MVGVPAFFLCDCGPSSRICWPICFFFSCSMNHGPASSEIRSDVNAAAMMRVEV